MVSHTLRIDNNTHELLKAIAYAHDLAMNDIVGRAVRAYVRGLPADDAKSIYSAMTAREESSQQGFTHTAEMLPNWEE